MEGGIAQRQIKMILIDCPIFLEGMLFAHYIHPNIKNISNCLSAIYGGGMMICAIIIRAKVPYIGVTELVHVPMFILGCTLLAKAGSRVFQCIHYVGKHSTTLWFIHGYFIWTFLTPLIYGIRFWPLAYVVFVAISLGVSLLIDLVLKKKSLT